jgi:hypothetical protein
VISITVPDKAISGVKARPSHLNHVIPHANIFFHLVVFFRRNMRRAEGVLPPACIHLAGRRDSF